MTTLPHLDRDCRCHALPAFLLPELEIVRAQSVNEEVKQSSLSILLPGVIVGSGKALLEKKNLASILLRNPFLCFVMAVGNWTDSLDLIRSLC